MESGVVAAILDQRSGASLKEHQTQLFLAVVSRMDQRRIAAIVQNINRCFIRKKLGGRNSVARCGRIEELLS